MVVEMQKCVLCKVPARTFCEPERASLCWDCDAKVHGANFLAARHSRILLCHACRSPTPWRASGARLNSTTVSVCDDCAAGEEEEEEDVSEGGNDEEVDTEDGDVDGDGVGDIQVVPWSSAASSSTGEWSLACTSKCNDNNIDVDDSVSEPLTTTVSLKRQRENDDAVDRDLQEGPDCLAFQRGGEVEDHGEPPLKEGRRPRDGASDVV